MQRVIGLSKFWMGWLLGALIITLLIAGVCLGEIFQIHGLSISAFILLILAWLGGAVVSVTSTKHVITHWERTGSGNVSYEVTDQLPTPDIYRGLSFSLFLIPATLWVVMLIIAAHYHS